MKGFKRVIACAQVVCLLFAATPAFTLTNPTEVSAAVSGITNNATYTLVNVFNGKALTQTNVETFWANAVVWNTDTLSDLARWKLTERDSYYSITNAYSGKSMKICGTDNGNNCDFNGYDNSPNYKWALEPITSGTYAGCYYIRSAVNGSNGSPIYCQVTSDSGSYYNDGAQVNLNNKIENEPRQIWRITASNTTDTEFNEGMADALTTAFRNHWYQYDNDSGVYSLGDGFWGIAEVMEGMLDGYETTGKSTYKDMFVNTWNNFIHNNGDYWTGNNYNDDISWAAIAACRAYMMIGNESYLTIAKKNFDFMYARASTYQLNGQVTGLLRWCEESGKRDTSNGCINGPATVAACYLGLATGDESYWQKARTIYLAQRNSNLYTIDGDEAGRVNDCIRSDGSVANYWVSTYNQGTYLGSAIMLYEHYGNQMYKTDANNIYNYTMNHLCYNKILKEENTNSGDLSGMRGILVRYIRKYALEMDSDDALEFFKVNSRVAWMNRNSNNLQQCSWQKKCSENVTWDSFAGYNAVCLVANMPTYGSSVNRNGFNRIEAEDMDYTRGLISENSSGTSGGRSLGGVQNNHYVGYYNVDFGSHGTNHIAVRYSKAKETDSPNSYIEVRLDSATGTLAGTVNLANTGNWETWSTVEADVNKITGKHDVYLVFKTNTSYCCNLDYVQFPEIDVTKNAFSDIDAQLHDAQEGIVDNSDGTIGGVQNNDWVEYDSVVFNSTANCIYFDAAVPSFAGGTISVYLDSMNNTPVATCELSKYGSTWSDISTQKFFLSSTIAPGTHTVFLKFAGSSYVCNLDSFKFGMSGDTTFTTGDVAVEGYQISTVNNGFRIVASVEPTIDYSNVVSYGLIYGLSSANGINYNVPDSDMVLGSSNSMVHSYDSTSNGLGTVQYGQSQTATYYVMTMKFGAFTPIAYTANYKVRPYARLANGCIAYGNTVSYTVYSVADYLYRNRLMNSLDQHNYLYNNILSAVNNDYAVVDYTWGGQVVNP